MPVSAFLGALNEAITVVVEVSENTILVLEVTIVAHGG